MLYLKKWLAKNLSWIVLNLPALLMVLALIYNPSLWKLLTPYSGYIAVILLVIVLSLNPLQALIPQLRFIRKINKYRRQIGVAVFSYAVVHFFCFFIKRDYNIIKTFGFFLHPAILPAVIALIIFLVLALTSNTYSVKKMGFPLWKKVHRLTYLAEVLIFLHMFILGYRLYALIVFTPLVVLQFLKKRNHPPKVPISS